MLRVVGNLSELQDAFEKGRDEIDKTRQALRRTQRNVNAVANGAGIAAAAIGGALVGLGKFAIDAAGQAETARASFRSFIGDAQQARTFYSDLVDFAQKSPLELPEIQNAATQLLAFGESVETVIPQIRILGVAVRALGVEGGMQQAIRALQGLKTGLFRTRQLARLGITREELRKFGIEFNNAGGLASSGAEAFQAAFQLLEQRFGPMADRVDELIQTKLSNIQDALFKFFLSLGESLSPVLAPALDEIIAAITEVANAISDPAVQQQLRASIQSLLGPVLDGLTRFIRGIAEAIRRDPDLIARTLRQIGTALKVLVGVFVGGKIIGMIINFTIAWQGFVAAVGGGAAVVGVLGSVATVLGPLAIALAGVVLWNRRGAESFREIDAEVRAFSQTVDRSMSGLTDVASAQEDLAVAGEEAEETLSEQARFVKQADQRLQQLADSVEGLEKVGEGLQNRVQNGINQAWADFRDEAREVRSSSASTEDQMDLLAEAFTRAWIKVKEYELELQQARREQKAMQLSTAITWTAVKDSIIELLDIIATAVAASVDWIVQRVKQGWNLVVAATARAWANVAETIRDMLPGAMADSIGFGENSVEDFKRIAREFEGAAADAGENASTAFSSRFNISEELGALKAGEDFGFGTREAEVRRELADMDREIQKRRIEIQKMKRDIASGRIEANLLEPGGGGGGGQTDTGGGGGEDGKTTEERLEDLLSKQEDLLKLERRRAETEAESLDLVAEREEIRGNDVAAARVSLKAAKEELEIFEQTRDEHEAVLRTLRDLGREDEARARAAERENEMGKAQNQVLRRRKRLEEEITREREKRLEAITEHERERAQLTAERLSREAERRRQDIRDPVSGVEARIRQVDRSIENLERERQRREQQLTQMGAPDMVLEQALGNVDEAIAEEERRRRDLVKQLESETERRRDLDRLSSTIRSAIASARDFGDALRRIAQDLARRIGTILQQRVSAGLGGGVLGALGGGLAGGLFEAIFGGGLFGGSRSNPIPVEVLNDTLQVSLERGPPTFALPGGREFSQRGRLDVFIRGGDGASRGESKEITRELRHKLASGGV